MEFVVVGLAADYGVEDVAASSGEAYEGGVVFLAFGAFDSVEAVAIKVVARAHKNADLGAHLPRPTAAAALRVEHLGQPDVVVGAYAPPSSPPPRALSYSTSTSTPCRRR